MLRQSRHAVRVLEKKTTIDEDRRQTRSQTIKFPLKFQNSLKNLNKSNRDHLNYAKLRDSKENLVVHSKITRIKGKNNSYNLPVTRSKSNLSSPIKSQANIKSSIKKSNIQKSNSVAEKKTVILPSNSCGQSAKRDLVKRAVFIKCTSYDKNSIVLAKQKYSIPWPVRILNIEKQRVFVHFFGDRRNGFVNKTEIYDFAKSVDAIKAILRSKKQPRSYLIGIREIELLLGVPSDESIIFSEVY